MDFGLTEVNALIERMPFNRYCGIECTSVHDDGLTVETALRPEYMNGAGTLHGGLIATLADVAIGLSIFRHFKGTRRPATTDLKVSYFRPILEGRLIARAHLLRLGNHLCTGKVDLCDSEGNLAAFAVVTYMLVD